MGLLAILAGGEAWARLTVPFVDQRISFKFVAGVGRMLRPNSTMQFTNLRDYWTVQRTNSLGFLDREVLPGANLGACRVALIGDSIVEAREVAIEDKVQVQIESLGRARLPETAVVAHGFGVWGTGQVAQLAVFDRYVRPLAAKLVVLVLHSNDLQDNFTPLKALAMFRIPWVTAERDGSGAFSLRPAQRGRAGPPVPWAAWRVLGLRSNAEDSLLERTLWRVERRSWFVRWLASAGVLKSRISPREHLGFLLAKVPELADPWNDLSWVDDMAPDEEIWALYARETLPPPLAAGLDYTAFAFAEFKARAQRDGFALVLLTTESVGPSGTPMFERLARLAAAAQIDVVNLYDYIVGQDMRVADASWRTDPHWSPTGHRWAAEALLEYLKANQHVCADLPLADPGDPASVAVLDP